MLVTSLLIPPVVLMDIAIAEVRDNEETRTIRQITGGPIEHRGGLADLLQRRRNIMRVATKYYLLSGTHWQFFICPGHVSETQSEDFQLHLSGSSGVSRFCFVAD